MSQIKMPVGTTNGVILYVFLLVAQTVCLLWGGFDDLTFVIKSF
jgi:hypothetical protein